MRRSPHAFLRGTARLFYALVRERGSLGLPKAPAGWLCGDLHVENFGVFSTEKDGAKAPERVIFAVNDFDDAVKGPLSLDVLRLATSLLLATRALVPAADARLALAVSLLDAYEEALSRGTRMAAEPRFVRQLRERAAKRRGPQLVSDRTEGAGKDVRFVRGDRYRTLTPGERRSARDAFLSYAASQVPRRGFAKSEYEIMDLAYRVAGTGSLGAFRVAVLTRGKKRHAPWLFDMKEELKLPSASDLLPIAKGRPADRVVKAVCALQPVKPAGLGTTNLAGRSMLVRRLSPQEDKLTFDDLVATDLPAIVPYLGSIVGEMHCRGIVAAGRSSPRWQLDRSALLSEAIDLAGVYETAHLLYAHFGDEGPHS